MTCCRFDVDVCDGDDCGGGDGDGDGEIFRRFLAMTHSDWL